MILIPPALILLQGEPWTSAIVGHEINPAKQQEEQQRLMLERFQAEVCMRSGSVEPC